MPIGIPRALRASPDRHWMIRVEQKYQAGDQCQYAEELVRYDESAEQLETGEH